MMDDDPAGNRTLVEAIARYVARAYRESGVDPKDVSSIDAWVGYVNTVEQDKRLLGQWEDTPQKYKDFLQLDGPGGQAFQEAWRRMKREDLIEAAGLYLPRGRNN